MKRNSRRLLTVGTILVVFAVAGCAASTSYEAPPPVPCETEEALASADACRAIYSCCTRDCDNTFLRSGNPGAIQECMATCATNLTGCYAAIE